MTSTAGIIYEGFAVNRDTGRYFVESLKLKLLFLGSGSGAMGSHLSGVCPHLGITPRNLNQSHAV